jgi:hypothetical protein
MYCIQAVSGLQGRRGRQRRGRRSVALGTVRCSGTGGVGLTGVRVVARQLGWRQAQRRRPRSGVRDGGVDQARWTRSAAAAKGGVASSLGVTPKKIKSLNLV